MISLIWAMDNNRLIGKQNALPWRLPADLKYFQRVTKGHAVVMGRKTYESIGKPLQQRDNIILTASELFHAEGCRVCHSVEELLAQLDPTQETFVIGGAEIYRQLLPYADKLYITLIDDEFEGDRYFPPVNLEADWQIQMSEQGLKDEQNPYDYFFTVWERKAKKENQSS
ncbi:dihydrofolate reductase [Brevibacillus fulvus]|uniref:Dihydrofolate reductase n=1 Tax=Brevibacillus fulvus TaxID=1125967 RepID=A0A938XRP4_9BACL|nr:dihydrofolate reductase [Brevibacillus fulvus]MBM7588622.1 dihydrofolate reductase [Brevibacillus fulvus]